MRRIKNRKVKDLGEEGGETREERGKGRESEGSEGSFFGTALARWEKYDERSLGRD